MNPLGIHTFVWTGSTAKADLDAAMEKSAALGYGLIEFPRLDPNSPDLDIDWLGKRLQDHKLKAALTMGLTLDSDISSENTDAVARGEKILDDAVRVTRDIGSHILGGILYSAHTKYQTMPTQQGWRNSAAARWCNSPSPNRRHSLRTTTPRTPCRRSAARCTKACWNMT